MFLESIDWLCRNWMLKEIRDVQMLSFRARHKQRDPAERRLVSRRLFDHCLACLSAAPPLSRFIAAFKLARRGNPA